MLRLVLDSHPNIRCFDESISYDYLSGRTGIPASADDKPDLVEAIGFKIPRFSEQLTWKEQIDPDYGSFSSFFKREKTLFVVRDVYDVVSSMMSLNAGTSQTWVERYAAQILRKTLPFNPYKKEFARKLSLLEQSLLPIHLVGAFYWEVKNQGLLALKTGGFDVLPLSYEAFVNDPRPHLESIVKFLGVSWSDELLNHHSLEHNELDENGMAIGNTDPRRAIDSSSVGRGRFVLSKEQHNDIRPFVENTLFALIDAGLCHDI